ncbi:DUF4136 domain-containing protein [Spirosoma rhododendri]|nr:DUF4136 domain-containing protein [Spirosoma rhododendri]
MKTGQFVWRGFASGMTNSNGFDRGHDEINYAVNLLFEKYGYRADK